ncbi:hypothetical protein SAMN00017405_0391 [Desulfonispora thiosulfatigenes DSM 11270]|uniref:Phage head-tail joining protein n=1 Tax=Desulfonispora thiosulfatigenes DSM 11270 TaxID=656914 RepID=A0A1W1VR15_DESTI|nr:hypothetical protein [Desulfonispora thiosulfatigenes]SMB95364.1 hypothetical protein SAMN00017405_0391 [Desulfonispora thiosulfatigenes DSM 11270]
MNFSNLIKKHSTIIKLISDKEGYYDYENGGTWVSGQSEPVDEEAAVFQLSIKDLNSNIQYSEGGQYTRQDIKIYIHKKLLIGQKIVYKDNEFTLSEEIDYTEHASGLRVYLARRAGE